MAKEGSTIGGLMDSLGTAVSVALQYGVPVESLVTKFAHQRFEPMGMTTNSDIPFAKSLVDYIFRWLGMQFIPGYREQNAPRRPRGAQGNAGSHGTQETPAIGTDAGRNETNRSREDSGCATTSSDSAWSVRRDRAIEIARSERGEPIAPTTTTMRSSVPASTQSITAVTAVTETLTSDGRMVESIASVERTVKTVAANALDASNAALMGDAPACDGCGAITVRNGTCYRCLNCGNSMGCS
jgi:ribonucleoside-diphosphate reductase alpha chain